MTKIFPSMAAFNEAHQTGDCFGAKNSDGTVTDYETLDAYIRANPEDFNMPLNPQTFECPPEGVTLRAVPVVDVVDGEISENWHNGLVLCSDGCGNEWYERKK